MFIWIPFSDHHIERSTVVGARDDRNDSVVLLTPTAINPMSGGTLLNRVFPYVFRAVEKNYGVAPLRASS
jgi:hypothetical protein